MIIFVLYEYNTFKYHQIIYIPAGGEVVSVSKVVGVFHRREVVAAAVLGWAATTLVRRQGGGCIE
jgi:hypothetical protein